MKIIECTWFPPKGYAAIMLVWWLIVKPDARLTAQFVNHEEIHQKQQFEMLILPFFLWYGLEFIVRLFQYRNWKEAYRNISFEREAYANQDNLGYLPKRKHFAWFNHIIKR